MRQRRPSPQTILVLRALLVRATEWRYGYDLTKEIGLQSGTLYPVLMRLADKGLLESAWHESDRPGAPPRHAYRLTQTGVAFASANIDATASAQVGRTPVPA
ncbi:PadR family transcriptional regulator [Sphingomonas sp. CFBP 13728]|uniref:PadR family transcriptional regulator n=1 Tax=unclassified Sphingomonas TaxID=196159 RepID=UPI00178176B8|nr:MULTISPECIES: PadR family transcriptional regulator [unclassified Sphingomonas]MBD8620423.1 PadR family transcriptional regulator [Sphingomonas sp. CFBP 13728]MBE2994208.1 PadR family transcriptional regulator [Sphingomonas sp. CFBP 13603]